MQVRFKEEQIKQADDAKAHYIQVVKGLIARPDHHGFDALCAYLREIDKATDFLMNCIRVLGKEMIADVYSAFVTDDWDRMDRIEESISQRNAVKTQKELQDEFTAHFVDENVKKVDEEYKNLDTRVTAFTVKTDPEQIKSNKNFINFLDKGAATLQKTCCVTFSDGSQLTWNPLGNALELAAARSEYDHKMAYLANDNRPALAK